MDTYLSLPYGHDTPLPEGYVDEVRTPDALVERFVRERTDPGDAVFDPFAGFGTTLAVAERLGREPHGLEYEPDRVRRIVDRLADPEAVRHADALRFDPDTVPACVLCFTSPPFMTEGMASNPFENYAGESTYDDYLADIETAFGRVADAVTPGGWVVLDVSNLRTDEGVTTLAWDLADAVSGVDALSFAGETVVTWERPPDHEGENYQYGYDHSYCLSFERVA
ncbi:DNA methyltransferase [Candidatus Halobonum tyrrellensis]|uniref:Type II methyltransferase n=1 Tax=Candidatus Halobonum tyrrellensis G22 TaxID=1324957 RepID=V4J012_9EURY|nr:DNA methyltransferase [Candidatus Halobonum tyrrellensis]ESP88767.1 DNA methylase N-4/N-6 domain-containing protein [Candidatus Halobonum tyrrellensis G22]